MIPWPGCMSSNAPVVPLFALLSHPFPMSLFHNCYRFNNIIFHNCYRFNNIIGAEDRKGYCGS